MTRILQMNELKVTAIKQQTAGGHTANKWRHQNSKVLQNTHSF